MIGVIPARGNSKGIPRKNLQEIGGESLLMRAINHSKDTCTHTIVSSEDDEILKIAEAAGVIANKRPRELSDDEANLRDVVASLKIADPMLVLLPSYPFRSIAITNDFINQWHAKAASQLCCVPAIDHPWLCLVNVEDGSTIFPGEGGTPVFCYRRQDRPPGYRIFHYLIACVGSRLHELDEGFVNGQTTSFYELKERPIDIDTKADLELARLMVENKWTI